MTKLKSIIRSSFYVLLITMASDGIGQEMGFEVLFNGENLDGWIGDKLNYQVENGAIVTNQKGEGDGNLFYEKEFSDFIFRFEFQLTPGANNGIGIHSPLGGDSAYEGKEIQVLDNSAEMYSDLKPYQYHGSVYGIIPAKRGFLKPVGEWNSEEITVRGDKIKVVLNGETIVNGNVKKATKNGTMDNRDHPGLQRNRGYLGFLGHDTVVRFRNIRIKDLSKK